MTPKGMELLEARRLLALAIDPIATAPIDEGDSAAYNFTIQQSPPARHRFRIEWGDGEEFVSAIFNPSITAFTTPSHEYRDNGAAPDHSFGGLVTVWSLDANGTEIEQAQRSFAQVVHNLPPSIDTPLAPRSAVEGESLTFEYLQIDRGEDDVITVTTDWGDGDVTVDQAVRVDRPEAGFDAFPSKPTPYAHAGTYPLIVTSVDDDGGKLIEQSQVIVQRTFALAGEGTVLSDTSYSLELRTTNPDLDEVDWLIDWDDGSPAQQIAVTMSAGAPAIVAHAFAGPVSFAAQIVATPSDDQFTYGGVEKSVDVLGELPAAPSLFGVEVSANTALDLPYAPLRQVKISWNSVVPQRIDSFDIERSSDGVSDWTTLADDVLPDPVGTTSLTDASAAQTFFYRVVTNYNGHRSAESPVMAARMEADYGFELRADVQENPAQITLHWTPADAATAAFSIYRKRASEPFWSFVDELPTTQSSYVDGDVEVGLDYEYRVDRVNVPRATASPDGIDRAFVMSGIALPLPANDGARGAILVIDSTAHADAAVAAGVEQLKLDLIGERYLVKELFVEPSDNPFAAHEIRSRIESLARSIAAPVSSIILIGHVPAPFSGHGGYDFHTDHLGAWSTDAFYGDLIVTRDGLGWTDNDTVPGKRLANENAPGDGKFDNDVVPSRIEAAVGRIDFFDPSLPRPQEFAALASYLAKDHRYRTEQTAFVKEAIIDVRLPRGQSGRAIPQYTMYEGLVGRESVTTRNWRAAFAAEPQVYQFGAAIAAGSWDRIFDPNEAEDPAGNLFSPFDPYDVKALFVQTTGSLFGDFYSYPNDENRNNVLRYLLRSGETLTNIYVETAPLEMHSSGMGESIGQSLLRTLNSQGEYDRRESSVRGSITLNLMGDPTLNMHIVAPVTDVTAVANKSNAVQITWTGTGTSAYRVYRAASIDGPFKLMGETDQTTMIDPSPGANHLYMVRAVELVQSRSGSYFAASTGVIVDAAMRHVPVADFPAHHTPLTPLTIRDAMDELDRDQASTVVA